MSGQSAKRLGLEVDELELELRLRRIELSLDKKIDANQDATQTGRGKGDVPQVTGLRVIGSTPGGATIGWNAVSISDLRRYELAFSTALSFAEDLQEYNEASTQYVFNTASDTGGGGGATWFARVRAVNSSGQKGVWSVTLNLTTGQAQTADLADGSVTSTTISTAAEDAITAAQVVYSNTASGLVALQVQAALDEILGKIVFTKSFTSAETALLTDGVVTIAHGLGVRPLLVTMTLVCKTADGDYVPGDQVGPFAGMMAHNHDGGTSYAGVRATMIFTDTTNVNIVNDLGHIVVNKAGGGGNQITTSRWRWVVRAFA